MAGKSKTSGPRGRASKPEIDFSALKPVELDEPLSISRSKEANPFTEMIKESVEKGKAYQFDNLPNERAAKQAVSLLSRGAEILDFGMSTRIEKYTESRKQLWRVKWQAKAERTRRPRKNTENGADGAETDE